MANIIGIPIISFALIFQSAIVSQITLLNGTADLVLLTGVSWIMHERVKAIWGWAIIAGLMVGYVSELPFWAPLTSYLLITSVGTVVKKRVWQVPILALLAVTFIGTLILHIISFGVLRFSGTPLDPIQSFNLIALPSMLLNLVLAIPVQGIINEVGSWIYPESIET